jgi:CRP-like cAMP-binding protein
VEDIEMANPLKEYAVPFHKGDVIFREGDNGSEMYVIQSGKVELLKEVNGEKVFSLIMEKGDFFGEMSLLESLPRTATAVMLEDGELIIINATIFDQMIRHNIEIAVRMLRKFSTRLRETMAKLESLNAVNGKIIKTTPLELGTEQEETKNEKIEDEKPPVLAQLLDEESLEFFPVHKEVTLIGRNDPVTGHNPDIDLTKIDTVRSVSRRHARLTYKEGTFYISEEPGTLNGTFVNNKKIQPGIQVPIKSGTIVGFGMVRLKFVEATQLGAGKREKK